MKPSDVSRHYDRLDVWYRSLWGEYLHHGLWERETDSREEASLNLRRAVARALRLEQGMEVCDVGCGYGGPGRWLAELTGAKITGVTNSAKQYAFLKANSGSMVPLYADWMENGLCDESFDAVLSLESISHFPDQAGALAEMWRVLKPGGRLVLATWVEREGMPAWARRLLLDPIRRIGMMPGLSTGSALMDGLFLEAGNSVSNTSLGHRVERTWSSGMSIAVRRIISDRDLFLDVMRHPRQAWHLAMSSWRVWLSYRLGLLDYLILSVEKSAKISECDR